MTSRQRLWIIGALAVAVVAAAIYFPFLRKRIRVSTQQPSQQSEEQARRELTQSLTPNPAARTEKATLFWLSDEHDGSLAPFNVELPLSSEPALRAKQVLNTLLAGPVNANLRTLPPDAELLEFYLLSDGEGIADFSESLTTSIPAGIQSEQTAVDSITKTLAANVSQVKTLKILIHGQEMDTLAGHVDLTQTFVVNGEATTTAAPTATDAKEPNAAGADKAGKLPAASGKPSATDAKPANAEMPR